MRVVVTGTPGTGKTTAVDHLDTDLEVIHGNRVIERESLYSTHDQQRDSAVVDLDAFIAYFDGKDDILVESHLSHHLPADRVIVLRCHPDELKTRLRDRGEPESTATENAESEALDLILTEAVTEHGQDAVYEIETTDRSPDTVADAINAVIRGDRSPTAGTVSYIDYLSDHDT